MTSVELNSKAIGAIRRLVDSYTSRDELKQFLLDAGANSDRIHSIHVSGNMKSPTYKSKSTILNEGFDTIPDEDEFLEKWSYIRNNPVKREHVQSSEEWVGFYQYTTKSTGKMPVPPDFSLDCIPPGYLMPVAYLWTRTVRCKNPSCGNTVPLVKQTWLCKKKGRYAALKVNTAKGGTRRTPASGDRRPRAHYGAAYQCGAAAR